MLNLHKKYTAIAANIFWSYVNPYFCGMRRYFITLCLGSMFVLFGLNQFDLYGQSYGLKAGGALSTVNGQHQVDNLHAGVQLGGYIKLGGTQPLYFKSELLFTHKGVRNWRGLEDIDRSRMNFVYV